MIMRVSKGGRVIGTVHTWIDVLELLAGERRWRDA